MSNRTCSVEKCERAHYGRGSICVLISALMILNPSATQAHPSSQHDDLRIKEVIRSVWPDAIEDAAIRVVRCESVFNPSARNSGGYRGLFQMGKREWRAYGNGGDVYDPYDNAAGALRLYRERGWQPWICKP